MTAQQKTHLGMANAAAGYITLACQHAKNGRSKRVTLPRFGGRDVIAYILATAPETVCEHCRVIAEKKYPQSIAKAKQNPEAFRAERLIN